MQLSISNSGLVEPVKQHIDDTKTHLVNAKSTAVNAPSGFQYGYYVNDLDSVINDYIKEVTYISNAINRVEDKYEDAWIEGKRKTDSLKEIDIKERTGLIK